MNYKRIFSKISHKLEDLEDIGNVASYIPELGNINPNKFGVHLTTVKNSNFNFGDSNEKFSIQSISKVLSLIMAFNLEDENLWNRVGVEPSGNPFNTLVLLEHNE